MSIESLFEDWCSLIETSGARCEPKETFGMMTKAYGEKGRYYHTIDHIAHCLNVLRLTQGFAEDIIAVELALWFHDYVYHIGAGSERNETESADRASTFCKEHGLEHMALKVRGMILVTNHLKPGLARTSDQRLVIDIDLSSLGAPWDDFRRNSHQIRQEYSHIPDEEFRKGRMVFLQSLLSRGNIYQTKYFIDNYEVQARNNIKEHIKELNAAPS